MSGPLISVVIPTYNRQDTLIRALDSLVEQTYSHWEAIVVDDGSLPRLRLPVPYRDHPQIQVHYQDNAGPGAARRRGGERAKGELICFLDDDDYYLPNHLEIIAGAYCGQNNLYRTEVLSAREGEGGLKEEPLKPADITPLLAYWRRPVSLLPFAISRKWFERVPPVVRRSPIEDFEWLIYLLIRAPLVRVPVYTVVYVRHAANRTNTLVARHHLSDRLAVLEAVYQLPALQRLVPAPEYHRRAVHHCLHWTRQCIRAGEWKAAWWGIRTALNYPLRNSMGELGYTALTALRTWVR